MKDEKEEAVGKEKEAIAEEEKEAIIEEEKEIVRKVDRFINADDNFRITTLNRPKTIGQAISRRNDGQMCNENFIGIN